MFGTAIAVFAVVAFVLPGFLIAQIAQGRRASPAAESDWTLVLRALSYSLVIHGAALFWTAHLYNELHDHPATWTHHVWAITLYATVILLVLPLILGAALGEILQRAESKGTLTWWHHAMGARDVRDAWDYAFQRTERETFVIVRTDKELVAGKYTQGSWAGRTPSPHDLYLEEVWLLSGSDIVAPMEPRYGVWIPESSIRDIYISRA